MVIFSGTPRRRIALVRNRLAACSSRCSVRRKSMVWPCLSTARYRERHSLSRVGFLRVVMIPMFLPCRLSLSLLPLGLSGGQEHLPARQEHGLFLHRCDGRPG